MIFFHADFSTTVGFDQVISRLNTLPPGYLHLWPHRAAC